jgi:isocitrate/isopropylmalate dehydrogenase
MKTYKIAAIAGDGIGKEVTAKDLDRVIVREWTNKHQLAKP